SRNSAAHLWTRFRSLCHTGHSPGADTNAGRRCEPLQFSILAAQTVVGHASCPLWVKSRHSRRKKSCPLYPQKRTCAVHLAMSALGQKRTSLYSTTSSARASSNAGTLRPSDFAVLTLITSSNLVG